MTDYDGPNISGVVDNSYVSALRMNLWASGQDNNTSLVRSQPIYLRIISLQWVQNESSYGVHEEKHKRYLLSHHMLGGHWRIHVSHLFRNFHRKKAKWCVYAVSFLFFAVQGKCLYCHWRVTLKAQARATSVDCTSSKRVMCCLNKPYTSSIHNKRSCYQDRSSMCWHLYCTVHVERIAATWLLWKKKTRKFQYKNLSISSPHSLAHLFHVTGSFSHFPLKKKMNLHLYFAKFLVGTNFQQRELKRLSQPLLFCSSPNPPNIK